MEDDKILAKLRKKKKLTTDEAVHLIFCPDGNVSEDENLSDAEDENIIEDSILDQDDECNIQSGGLEVSEYLAQNNIEMTDESSCDKDSIDKENILESKWRKKEFNLINDPEWKDSLVVDESWSSKSPLEFFYSIFEEELFEYICTQSNLYAMQKDCKEVGLTTPDIKAYVAILLKMGILHPPYYRYFWRNSTAYSSIINSMSMNKFDTIKRYLHFNNNSNENNDKLHKIRPIIDSIRKNCNKIAPEEHQAVDEQIIPTKARSSLKQYLPKKPHKWGYKVISRAGQSGIIYDFEIYSGQNSSIVPQHGLGVASSYVMRLSEGIPTGKNYKSFYDNWFSSIPLAKKLSERGILSLATIRANRLKGCIMKEEMSLKKEGRGSYDYRVDITNKIIAIKWYDNKSVHVISTYAGVDPVSTCRRWDAKEKCYIVIDRPFAIEEYNKFMGGVDLSNMLIMLYRINFKSRKWYMRIFHFFLDLSVVNAWLIYRRVMKSVKNNHPLRLVDFKEDIAEGLLAPPPIKRGRPCQTSPVSSKKMCFPCSIL